MQLIVASPAIKHIGTGAAAQHLALDRAVQRVIARPSVDMHPRRQYDAVIAVHQVIGVAATQTKVKAHARQIPDIVTRSAVDLPAGMYILELAGDAKCQPGQMQNVAQPRQMQDVIPNAAEIAVARQVAVGDE